MSTLINDVKYAFRQLRKSPGFTMTAVLTLAIGIGANTAIFSTVDALLLQSLPYDESDRLVAMCETNPRGIHNSSVSGGAFLDWKSHIQSLEYMTYARDIDFNLTGMGQPERVAGLQVTADYLRTLRVDPIVGRGFASEEDQLGQDNQVVVLNYGYWKSRFGSDPDVLGSVISLDQKPYTIIGVLPPNKIMYRGWEKGHDSAISFLLPLVIDPQWQRYSNHGHVIGRLKPGLSIAQADAELRSIREREDIKPLYPTYKQQCGVAVSSLQEKWTPRKVRPTLVTLLGTTAMVLLIACANVGNLLLARGNARQKEMAIRTALGAGSWRIIRQVLLESLLLGLIGGVLGIIIAVFGMDLAALAVDGLYPEMRHPKLNIRMLLFSISLACGCGVLFGTLPALRACKIDFNSKLKEGGRSGTSGSHARSQSLLVISEVALTVLLLIGAGLFMRSFLNVLDVDPGFNTEKTLAFDLRFPDAKYPKREDRSRFIKDLTERINMLPGIESVASAMALPLGKGHWQDPISRVDKPNPAGRSYEVGHDFVSADYFSTMGITLLGGRLITEADNQKNAPHVIVIDSQVAQDLYPNENPIGHYLRLPTGNQWEIVGVVAPVHCRRTDANPYQRVYVAQVHNPDRTSIIIRTAIEPLSLVQAVRETILSINPGLPMFNIRTMEQAIQSSVAKKHTTLILLGSLAAVAVSLVCVGLYGFMSYFVGQRTRELCIRSALGAQRLDIFKHVVGVGMKLSVIGIVIGLIAAFVLARLLESQLFEIKTHDPLVYIVSVCLVGLVAFLSVYLPARRVAKIDPMEALRYE